MKRLFLVSILLLISFLASAQMFELGMTTEEVYFDHRFDNIQESRDTNGNIVLKYRSTMGNISFHFDSLSKCNMVILYTKDENVLDNLINNYNKNYEIIGDGRWRQLIEYRKEYLFILKWDYIFTYFTISQDKVDNQKD